MLKCILYILIKTVLLMKETICAAKVSFFYNIMALKCYTYFIRCYMLFFCFIYSDILLICVRFQTFSEI